MSSSSSSTPQPHHIHPTTIVTTTSSTPPPPLQQRPTRVCWEVLGPTRVRLVVQHREGACGSMYNPKWVRGFHGSTTRGRVALGFTAAQWAACGF
ncbi:hypothetical protein Tco_1451937 [Tanacetum coccineum]